MVTRMDGFRGLYEHTQKNLVDKLPRPTASAPRRSGPPTRPPEAPKGEALKAEVSEWQMGKENDAMIHDLEVGIDGKVYTVDMTADAMEVLDPVTGKREIFSIPGGKADDFDARPDQGTPFGRGSAPNGELWITLRALRRDGEVRPQDQAVQRVPGRCSAAQAGRLSAHAARGQHRQQGVVDRTRPRRARWASPRSTPRPSRSSSTSCPTPTRSRVAAPAVSPRA